jgi:hypothetical protein
VQHLHLTARENSPEDADTDGKKISRRREFSHSPWPSSSENRDLNIDELDGA